MVIKYSIEINFAISTHYDKGYPRSGGFVDKYKLDLGITTTLKIYGHLNTGTRMSIGNLLKYQDLLFLRAGKTGLLLLNIVLAWVLRHLVGCTP